MKKKNLLTVILMFTLIYFSPQTIEAVDSVNEVVEIENKIDIQDKNPGNIEIESKQKEQDESTSGSLENGENEKYFNINEDDLTNEKPDEKNETENKVELHSRNHKNNTNEKILKNGVRDPKVVDLKVNLALLGFTVEGKGTSLYGPKTEVQVRKFQKYYGLIETGVVDDITQEKIEKLLSSPLQNGKRHQKTVQLKKDLAQLGFAVPGNGTTLYGENTTEKVREFQSFYNLTINGIADEVTLSKIDELLQQPLSKGMKRKDVKQLKHDLAELGFSVPGNGTTLYGEKTEEKVKEFQTYYSLEVTGVVYESTQAKIEEILSSPLQNGKRHQKTVQLKKDLAQLGFAVPGNGTTLYGENTTEKVREFQSFYNLTINGIADEVTLSKIDELLQQPLSKGMKRKDVKQLKHDLAELGFSVPGNGTTLYGEKTEEKVKEFQSYYSLEVTGVVYESTQAKIEEILSSPLQEGRRHQSTVQLKKDLAQLGFAVPGNGTTFYGKSTTRKVKEFQIYYNLKVNGIADEVTLEKIEEILSSPLQNGQKDAYTVILKKNLDKLGFTVPGNGTTLYGKNTMKKVKEFQSHYKLKVNGIADAVTLAKIDEILSSPLQNGKRHKDVIKLKNNLAKIGYKVSNNPTTLYGNKTEKRVKEFQQDNKLPQSGIADEITLKLLNQKVEENPIKVFLDPGHGGKDPGAKGFGIQEKDVVLDIVNRAATNLTTKYIGVEVKVSRKTDNFIELTDRAKMANDWGADYFVSVHNNSFNGSASGFESYIYNGSVSKKTKEMQSKMHQYLSRKLELVDRGKKRANFSVLRNTNMPAILLEYLFIDNRVENSLLKDAKYRNWLGEITADAIANTFNLKKKY